MVLSDGPPQPLYKQNFVTEIPDIIKFEKKLKEIAEQGLAIEDEELASEVRSVAAPIYDYTRCVVGAISVSGPTIRFSKTRMHEQLIPLVKRAAEEISLRLGY